MRVDVIRGGIRQSPSLSSQQAASAAFFASLAREAHARADSPQAGR